MSRPKIEWPDPNRPAEPTRADKIAKGEDCCRGPVTGCIISQSGGTPQEEELNYLYSLRHATEQGVAGREHDLSEAEYQTKCREVVEYYKTNTVSMPPPYIPLGFERATKGR